jgi:RNA polymerase sigma-70 factor (ECF subfamily)
MGTTLTATLSSSAHPTAETISAEGFDEIVRQHQRRVYRVIFLLLKDADAADTLTQECFLRAFEKRASFRGECALATWLLRIAVNLVRDHSKSRRQSFWRKLVGLQDQDRDEDQASGAGVPNLATSEPSPERALLARETLQEVWNAVDSLSPQQQTVFLLRFAEEMSLAEIAAVLRVKVGTVKAQLFRATSKVKEAVKEKSCG